MEELLSPSLATNSLTLTMLSSIRRDTEGYSRSTPRNINCVSIPVYLVVLEAHVEDSRQGIEHLTSCEHQELDAPTGGLGDTN